MTYIPYDSNVPEFLSDSLEETQPDLLNNFQTLFDIFAKNHIVIDDPFVPGNHSVIQLVQQNSPIETNTSEINIYNKNTETSTNQIFLRYQGNGQEFAYTCYQIYGLKDIKNDNNIVIQSPFFTFLPGNILVYFGSYRNPSNSTSTKARVNINLSPPIAKKIISVSISPSSLNRDDLSTQKAFPKPIADVVKNKSGFFDQIQLRTSSDTKSLVPSGFYLVLANI